MTDRWKRSSQVFAVTVGLSLAGAGPLCAQTLDEAKATKVKAAYVYNFAKFATWPASAFESDVAPLVIGVVGPDDIAGVLERVVSGKTVNGRSIEVRRIADISDSTAAALRDCHLLYVCACESDHVAQLWRMMEHQPVLVVSDMDGFAERGGMIGLALDGSRIVFEIHRGAVERAGLQLSAKLLKLARIVG